MSGLRNRKVVRVRANAFLRALRNRLAHRHHHRVSNSSVAQQHRHQRRHRKKHPANKDRQKKYLSVRRKRQLLAEDFILTDHVEVESSDRAGTDLLQLLRSGKTWAESELPLWEEDLRERERRLKEEMARLDEERELLSVIKRKFEA